MIKHGVNPVKWHARDLSIHKTAQILAGAVGLPADMPTEFDFDAKLTMPNQNEPDAYFNIPAMPNGCTGETQNDICVDEDRILYDPFFVYSNTRAMEGSDGQDVGCDVRDSLKSLSIYGLEAKDNVDPWTRRRGVYMNALANRGKLDAFDALRAAMWLHYKLTGVMRTLSIVTPWLREWDIMHVASDGIATAQFLYDGIPGNHSWHNWKGAGFVTRNTKGQLIRNGELFLKAKTWQGKTYGDNGFSYYDREAVNKIFAIPLTGAFLPGVKLNKEDAAQVGNVIQVIREQISNFLQRQFALLFARHA